MRAVVLTGHGGPEKLEYHINWPAPSLGPADVLIAVAACGVNNTDINTRTGWYAREVRVGTNDPNAAVESDGGWGGGIQFPRIQGADVVGTVLEAGPEADQTLVGNRVLVEPWLRDWDEPLNIEKYGYLGSEADGGFEGLMAIDYRNAHPIDSAYTDAELATFPTAYLTAENMLDRGEVALGETVLVTGASGGVGSALMQLGRRRGAAMIGVAGAGKMEGVRELGASAVLPRENADLAAALKGAAGITRVDKIMDIVGGQTWPTLIGLLRPGGAYICSGAIAGPIVELDLRTLYLNDLKLIGSTAVPPGTFGRLVKYIENKEIQPLLAREFPLEELPAAQAFFLKKEIVGKIVITI